MSEPVTAQTTYKPPCNRKNSTKKLKRSESDPVPSKRANDDEASAKSKGKCVSRGPRLKQNEKCDGEANPNSPASKSKFKRSKGTGKPKRLVSRQQAEKVLQVHGLVSTEEEAGAESEPSSGDDSDSLSDDEKYKAARKRHEPHHQQRKTSCGGKVYHRRCTFDMLFKLTNEGKVRRIFSKMPTRSDKLLESDDKPSDTNYHIWFRDGSSDILPCSPLRLTERVCLEPWRTCPSHLSDSTESLQVSCTTSRQSASAQYGKSKGKKKSAHDGAGLKRPTAALAQLMCRPTVYETNSLRLLQDFAASSDELLFGRHNPSAEVIWDTHTPRNKFDLLFPSQILAYRHQHNSCRTSNLNNDNNTPRRRDKVVSECFKVDPNLSPSPLSIRMLDSPDSREMITRHSCGADMTHTLMSATAVELRANGSVDSQVSPDVTATNDTERKAENFVCQSIYQLSQCFETKGKWNVVCEHVPGQKTFRLKLACPELEKSKMEESGAGGGEKEDKTDTVVTDGSRLSTTPGDHADPDVIASQFCKLLNLSQPEEASQQSECSELEAPMTNLPGNKSSAFSNTHSGGHLSFAKFPVPITNLRLVEKFLRRFPVKKVNMCVRKSLSEVFREVREEKGCLINNCKTCGNAGRLTKKRNAISASPTPTSPTVVVRQKIQPGNGSGFSLASKGSPYSVLSKYSPPNSSHRLSLQQMQQPTPPDRLPQSREQQEATHNSRQLLPLCYTKTLGLTGNNKLHNGNNRDVTMKYKTGADVNTASIVQTDDSRHHSDVFDIARLKGDVGFMENRSLSKKRNVDEGGRGHPVVDINKNIVVQNKSASCSIKRSVRIHHNTCVSFPAAPDTSHALGDACDMKTFEDDFSNHSTSYEDEHSEKVGDHSDDNSGSLTSQLPLDGIKWQSALEAGVAAECNNNMGLSPAQQESISDIAFAHALEEVDIENTHTLNPELSTQHQKWESTMSTRSASPKRSTYTDRNLPLPSNIEFSFGPWAPEEAFCPGKTGPTERELTKAFQTQNTFFETTKASWSPMKGARRSSFVIASHLAESGLGEPGFDPKTIQNFSASAALSKLQSCLCKMDDYKSSHRCKHQLLSVSSTRKQNSVTSDMGNMEKHRHGAINQQTSETIAELQGQKNFLDKNHDDIKGKTHTEYRNLISESIKDHYLLKTNSECQYFVCDNSAEKETTNCDGKPRFKVEQTERKLADKRLEKKKRKACQENVVLTSKHTCREAPKLDHSIHAKVVHNEMSDLKIMHESLSKLTARKSRFDDVDKSIKDKTSEIKDDDQFVTRTYFKSVDAKGIVIKRKRSAILTRKQQDVLKDCASQGKEKGQDQVSAGSWSLHPDARSADKATDQQINHPVDHTGPVVGIRQQKHGLESRTRTNCTHILAVEAITRLRSLIARFSKSTQEMHPPSSPNNTATVERTSAVDRLPELHGLRDCIDAKVKRHVKFRDFVQSMISGSVHALNGSDSSHLAGSIVNSKSVKSLPSITPTATLAQNCTPVPIQSPPVDESRRLALSTKPIPHDTTNGQQHTPEETDLPKTGCELPLLHPSKLLQHPPLWLCHCRNAHVGDSVHQPKPPTDKVEVSSHGKTVFEAENAKRSVESNGRAQNFIPNNNNRESSNVGEPLRSYHGPSSNIALFTRDKTGTNCFINFDAIPLGPEFKSRVSMADACPVNFPRAPPNSPKFGRRNPSTMRVRPRVRTLQEREEHLKQLAQPRRPPSKAQCAGDAVNDTKIFAAVPVKKLNFKCGIAADTYQPTWASAAKAVLMRRSNFILERNRKQQQALHRQPTVRSLVIDNTWKGLQVSTRSICPHTVDTLCGVRPEREAATNQVPVKEFKLQHMFDNSPRYPYCSRTVVYNAAKHTPALNGNQTTVTDDPHAQRRRQDYNSSSQHTNNTPCSSSSCSSTDLPPNEQNTSRLNHAVDRQSPLEVTKCGRRTRDPMPGKQPAGSPANISAASCTEYSGMAPKTIMSLSRNKTLIGGEIISTMKHPLVDKASECMKGDSHPTDPKRLSHLVVVASQSALNSKGKNLKSKERFTYGDNNNNMTSLHTNDFWKKLALHQENPTMARNLCRHWNFTTDRAEDNDRQGRFRVSTKKYVERVQSTLATDQWASVVNIGTSASRYIYNEVGEVKGSSQNVAHDPFVDIFDPEENHCRLPKWSSYDSGNNDSLAGTVNANQQSCNLQTKTSGESQDDILNKFSIFWTDSKLLGEQEDLKFSALERETKPEQRPKENCSLLRTPSTDNLIALEETLNKIKTEKLKRLTSAQSSETEKVDIHTKRKKKIFEFL